MANAISFKIDKPLSLRAQRMKKWLHAAITHHKKRQFAEADILYKKIRRADPNNAVAIQLSGVLAYQVKQFDLSLNFLNRAISLKPDYADALNNRGVVLRELKRFDEAMADYNKAIALKPNYTDAIHNRGNLLQECGRLDEALRDYNKAISLKPDYIEAFGNRGNALQKLGRLDEAMADYNNAICLKPDYVDAHYNRGNLLKDSARLDEALQDYNKAISLRPNHPEALNNRANTLRDLKRFDEALEDYNKLKLLRPDHPEAFNNRGAAFRDLKRFDEAIQEYQMAISLKPDYAEAFNNIGSAMQDLGRFDEAMENFDKAITLKPDLAEAHLNKSLQLLKQGEFTSGWEGHEWRWKSSSCTTPVREFSQPLWLGEEDLYGKTILLHWEQGFGDTIQFSRYAKEVSRLGCKTILEVQKPLFELMKTIEGVDELIASGTDLPPFDFYCPLMSLPLAMGTTLDTIPLGEPYLNSVDDKLAKWSSRLGPKSNLRVGMVWSGNAKHKNDHNRSIALEQMLSAIPEGYELVSLQKEVRETDLTVLEKTKQVRHFGAELDDFSDTAALCDLMDVIISVDTSVAHLAGALGKPLKLLLPDNSDFRWLLDRSDSPWYPSMRLFAQGIDKLWEPVLEKINDDLKRVSS